jgi:hypothetical protein
MASGRRGTGLGATIVAFSTIVIASILSLSLVWDADGNPNTDNLPQAVVCVEARTVAEADVHVEDRDDPLPCGRHRGIRWLLRRPLVVREWRWRPFGVPQRGP